MATTTDEVALLQDEIVDLLKRARHEAQVAVLEGLRDILEKEIDGDIATPDPPKAARAKPRRGGSKKARPSGNGRARDDLKDDEFIGAVGAGRVCGIDGCDFVGKTAQGLSTHRARKHKGTGDFPCSVEGCAHVSQTKSGLQIHDRRKHRNGGGAKPSLGLGLCDTGEAGVCDKAADGGCDGGVSEWTCEYERTANCKHTVRRCQAHGGDRSSKMSLGHHHRKHDQAGHDAPIDFGASP